MKDILQGFTKTQRKLFIKYLRDKIEFFNSPPGYSYESVTLELESSVAEKLKECCSIFRIDTGDLVSLIVIDFLQKGEVQSPVNDSPTAFIEGATEVFKERTDDEIH